MAGETRDRTLARSAIETFIQEVTREVDREKQRVVLHSLSWSFEDLEQATNRALDKMGWVTGKD